MGSIFLIDTQVPGYGVAWQVILLMSIVTASFFFIIIHLAIRSMRKKIETGQEALIGSKGRVIECRKDLILVQIKGEIWKAKSSKPLQNDQAIRVTAVTGLLLTIDSNESETMDKEKGSEI